MTDRELVQALCGIEDGLTDWELGFVESLAVQALDKQRPISARQRQVALRIYEGVGA